MQEIKPTHEILERITKNAREHPEGSYDRIFRYLLREDIYYIAFQHLYSNKGAMTKGINDDTADGFGAEYVNQIIFDLRYGLYKATPVRRTYIPKKNGKMRPLGIPSFRDKLLQEAIRMFLEAIYEPTFSPNSHGFRPLRSCHTAFKRMQHEFIGVPWVIEGDIKACFDDIDHKTLMNILGQRIKDYKFLHIIKEFLKAGYMEDWVYYETYSGAPQGSIVSPILANIYLSELDKKVEEIKQRFETNNPPDVKSPTTKEYRRISKTCTRLKKQIGELPIGTERNNLVKELHKKRIELRKVPCTAPVIKKIAYIRYADDWVIGVKGTKEECKQIKEEIRIFLDEKLKLTLSEEKTLITHSSKKIRFLGYDISVRRSQQVKGYKTKSGENRSRRTLHGTVNLEVPLDDKIMAYLFKKGAIVQLPDGNIRPRHRKELLGKPDHEIVKTYNSETRGLLNFYSLASNYYKLSYFCYLMERSCLFTLAAKHKKSVRKYKNEHKVDKDNGGWAVPYKTKSGEKKITAIKFKSYEPY